MNQQERFEYINKLETDNQKSNLDAKLKAAKEANRQQYINLAVSFIAERARLELLAVFGLIKLDT